MLSCACAECVRRMCFIDSASQVSTSAIDDAYWGRPEDYKRQRPSFKIDRHHPGSDLAAEVAAAMAATAMVFKKTNSTYSR